MTMMVTSTAEIPKSVCINVSVSVRKGEVPEKWGKLLFYADYRETWN